MRLEPGKLPPDLLRQWLDRVPEDDPDVLIGARYGFDAAAIRMGDEVLVAKTDPITFTAGRLGWYALNINANDLACLGARPRWFLATLLLPYGTEAEQATAIFDDLLDACRRMDVALCGGHTEVSPAVTQPVMVGQMLGTTVRDAPLNMAHAQPGDVLLLTKGIAIEGTAILACEKADALRGESASRARNFLDSPGISVLQEALAAARIDGVRGMHDPTEGGLAAGIAEAASAAGCGARIDRSAIRIYPETEALCTHFGIDPMGLIASGALLIAVAPERAEEVIAAVDVPCARIGELTEDPDLVLVTEDGERPLTYSSRDEITKVLQPLDLTRAAGYAGGVRRHAPGAQT